MSSSEDDAASPVLGMAELLQDFEPVKPLQRGDIVDGEVMAIDGEGILVNVGHKYEGVVPPREMRSLTPEKLQEIKPGSKIYVYVVRPASDEDQAILSLDRAQKEEGWFDLQKRLDENEAVEGKIQGMNRGGAVVEVKGTEPGIFATQ